MANGIIHPKVGWNKQHKALTLLGLCRSEARKGSIVEAAVLSLFVPLPSAVPSRIAVPIGLVGLGVVAVAVALGSLGIKRARHRNEVMRRYR